MFEKNNIPKRDHLAQYELSSGVMQQRIKVLLEERPPKTRDRIVCYKLEDAGMADVARTVERTVFEAKFGNDAAEMSKIYGPYEEASTFFLSVNQYTSEPVGALRVTENSQSGIMTLEQLPPGLTDLNENEILQMHQVASLNDCWDVGTVAVLPEYRKQGKGVSVQLYRAMYKTATQQNIEHLFSIIDERAYDTLTSYLGIPFVPLADTEPFEFEGSTKSQAVYGYTPDFYKKMSRKSLSINGVLARKALWPLVFGTKDDAIDL